MKIVVDAMGGDHSPGAIVEGAVLAVREFGLAVILVGIADRVQKELEKHKDWESLAIDEASGIDKTVYAQIQNRKVEKIEDTEFKEMYEKDWNEESSLMVFNVRWKLYDKIRAYHLIEIAIAIAVGVYLWLE